jgi:hypothetical protein
MGLLVSSHICYRCDIARHDYGVHQQQGQRVVKELCMSSATSTFEKHKEYSK